MYNSDLEPQGIWGNMYIVAVVLELLNNLAMEREFSERIRELSKQAWNFLPEKFMIEFPED